MRKIVAQQDTLEILVDATIHLACDRTPSKVIAALRRYLRQHGVERLVNYDRSQRSVLNLLQTRGGSYHLPQALLAQLVDICRRHGVAHQIVDRRQILPVPRLRPAIELTAQQRQALRSLLVRDNGVLAATDAQDRLAVAVELIARRQQRTLVVTPANQQGSLLRRLAGATGMGGADLAAMPHATGDSRMVLASYQHVLAKQDGELLGGYGMVVFDGLAEVDPVTLMRSICICAARYTLGLSEELARADGLHGPLYLALGGTVQHLVDDEPTRGIQLALRGRPTSFVYPYEGRAQYQALLTELATDAARNRLISQDVGREAQAGHPCLVLSERRDQLDRLRALLPADIAKATETITSNVRPAERAAVLARFNRGDIDVLLATGQIASDSLRIERARRLFIAFPFSYARKLERIVATLMQPSAGKRDVVVYDYDDVLLAPLHRAYDKRAKVLSRLRSTVEQEQLRRAQMDLGV